MDPSAHKGNCGRGVVTRFGGMRRPQYITFYSDFPLCQSLTCHGFRSIMVCPKTVESRKEIGLIAIQEAVAIPSAEV